MPEKMIWMASTENARLLWSTLITWRWAKSFMSTLKHGKSQVENVTTRQSTGSFLPNNLRKVNQNGFSAMTPPCEKSRLQNHSGKRPHFNQQPGLVQSPEFPRLVSV